MSKGILVLDIPDCCAECYFRSELEEFTMGKGFYKKISRCRLAPEAVEDPWRDITWQMEHRESWCPFKPVPEKYDMDAYTVRDKDWDGEYEYGWNACVDEILKGDNND